MYDEWKNKLNIKSHLSPAGELYNQNKRQQEVNSRSNLFLLIDAEINMEHFGSTIVYSNVTGYSAADHVVHNSENHKNVLKSLWHQQTQ